MFLLSLKTTNRVSFDVTEIDLTSFLFDHRMFLDHQPTHVGEEETSWVIVRIRVGVRIFVVDSFLVKRNILKMYAYNTDWLAAHDVVWFKTKFEVEINFLLIQRSSKRYVYNCLYCLQFKGIIFQKSSFWVIICIVIVLLDYKIIIVTCGVKKNFFKSRYTYVFIIKGKFIWSIKSLSPIELHL